VKIANYRSEEILILDLQKGDRQALEWIYRTYWPMIVHFVRLNKGTQQEAEDLYQESILTLYEQVRKGNFRMNSSIKTYLYSICRNKWLSQLRVQKNVTDIDEYREEIAEEDAESDLSLPNDSEIRKAIEGLGEPCRTLLTGFYYHKLSLEQLAEQLNYASTNVAKQQKFRCVERLKKQFLDLKQ
jgi:RNA polymerase sigma factor (sigma-70 family)